MFNDTNAKEKMSSHLERDHNQVKIVVKGHEWTGGEGYTRVNIKQKTKITCQLPNCPKPSVNYSCQKGKVFYFIKTQASVRIKPFTHPDDRPLDPYTVLCANSALV